MKTLPASLAKFGDAYLAEIIYQEKTRRRRTIVKAGAIDLSELSLVFNDGIANPSSQAIISHLKRFPKLAKNGEKEIS